MGRTQAEMRYILETVLSHLPPVTGSEENMKVHIVQKSGFNYNSSADEFGQDTGMANSHLIKPMKNFKNGSADLQKELE